MWGGVGPGPETWKERDRSVPRVKCVGHAVCLCCVFLLCVCAVYFAVYFAVCFRRVFLPRIMCCVLSLYVFAVCFRCVFLLCVCAVYFAVCCGHTLSCLFPK